MKKSRDALEKSAAKLIETQARLMRQSLDTAQSYVGTSISDSRKDALDLIPNIVTYIDYLAAFIVDAETDRSKEEALSVLDILLTSLEVLARLGFRNTAAELDLLRERQLQAEKARRAIQRKPKSFYDQIVADVFHEHVAANGEWKGKPMRLAQQLRDSVNERTALGGGDKLKDDTIARKLKLLLKPTEH